MASRIHQNSEQKMEKKRVRFRSVDFAEICTPCRRDWLWSAARAGAPSLELTSLLVLSLSRLRLATSCSLSARLVMFCFRLVFIWS